MNKTSDWELTQRLEDSASKGDPVAAAIIATRMSMVITDPRQDDNPIVFVNDAFLMLTRYSRDEIIGRNCRFLQGPETDPQAVQSVRNALADRRDISIDLLNYRKDGTMFWNALYISPAFSPAGELLYFFASQVDSTVRVEAARQLEHEKNLVEAEIAQKSEEFAKEIDMKTMLLHEVDHRVKNHLQMISSLILMQNNMVHDPKLHEVLNTILHRIETVSAIHTQLYRTERPGYVDFSKIAEDISLSQEQFSTHRQIKIELDSEPAFISSTQSTPLGLIYNELLTNAYKHAFPGNSTGLIRVTVRPEGEYVCLCVTDNGVGNSDSLSSGDSFGQTLIKALIKQTGASMSVSDVHPGVCIKIIVPVVKGAYMRKG